MRLLIFTFLLAFVSCRSADEHGHSHDEEGAHTHTEDQMPAEQVTVWTEHSEWFVEFPALVVGQTSRFAAHVTALDGHEPVREGAVTVSLIQGNKGIRHTVDAPSSPGIFTPALQPREAGLHRLVLEVSTPTFTDRMQVDDVRVFATAEEAARALSGQQEDGGLITFLKEQAWRMEFQTVPVQWGEIYQTIPASGVWRTDPSAVHALVAPTDGRVNLGSGILTEGRQVEEGDVLMTVLSEELPRNNLSAEIQMALADLEQATSEHERKQALHASGIISDAEYEQVEQKRRRAEVAYQALSRGFTSGGTPIRSPRDGFLRDVRAINGGFVRQGDLLASVNARGRRLLEVQVSPRHMADLRDIRTLWYLPGTGGWSSLEQTGGTLLSVGRTVDATRPLLTVHAQVNEDVEVPDGGFAEVQIAVGSPTSALVVPLSSLLEDYGAFSVIVQRSGETFERREVTLGRRNGHQAEVISGLSLGERVVARGAYHVKMASMSGQAPAHGHEH